MSQVKKQYKEYIKNIKTIESLEKNRKIILLLVENYLLRAKKFAVDGAFCVVLSEEIMKKVFIPDVTGMKFKEALSVLGGKGLNNVLEGKIKQTLSKKLERRVFDQKPQVKKRVKKDTKIILDHYASYGDTVESLMAQKKCSKNTVKVWNEVLKEVDCVCEGPAFVWNINGSACITKREAEEEIKNDAMSKANCPSKFPGSENFWNALKKEVDCICPEPALVWNKAQNACITKDEAMLENLDCSQWPGSVPGYFDGKAGCVCPSPLYRNKDNSACITEEEARLENANCQNGKVAILDYGVVKCQCPQRTWWVESLGKCATQYEWSEYCNSQWPGTVPSNNDLGCSCPNGTTWFQELNKCANNYQVSAFCDQQHPGSVPQWDNQNNRQICVCPQGTKPQNNRCVSSQQQPVYVPPVNVKKGKCNNAHKAGGNKPQRFEFDLGGISSFEFKYNTINAKDRIIIFEGNRRIFDSKCVGTGGWKTVQISKNPNSRQILIDVQPRCDGKKSNTRWYLKVVCPK